MTIKHQIQIIEEPRCTTPIVRYSTTAKKFTKLIVSVWWCSRYSFVRGPLLLSSIAFKPSRNALRKFTPKCIAQKFLMTSTASQLAGPNLCSSSSLFSWSRLLNYFWVDADSEIAADTSVQLILSAFGIFITSSYQLLWTYQQLCFQRFHLVAHSQR